MQDEVLAHRLGMVPIRADPSRLDDRHKGEAANESNTVVLRLSQRCTTVDGDDSRVYSSALQWLPEGSEVRGKGRGSEGGYEKPGGPASEQRGTRAGQQRCLFCPTAADEGGDGVRLCQEPGVALPGRGGAGAR